jgi:DNA-binding PadR family transcriptional regulator
LTDPAGIPLAPRDFLILLVLAEGPTHGYGVVTAAERTTTAEVPLDPANLYRALRRMLRDGWVRKLDGEGQRTRFELTVLGREVVRAEARRLDELLHRARPLLSEEG